MKINPYLISNTQTTSTYTATSNAGAASTKEDVSKTLKNLGVSDSETMQSAYSIIKTNTEEIPSKSTMQATQSFLEKTSGTNAQKLLTIQAASAKGIELTEKNLTAVHSALNGSASEDLAVDELSGEMEKPSAELTPEERRELVKTMPAALKERVYNTLRAAGFSEAEVEEVGNRLLLGEKSESIIADLKISRGIQNLKNLFEGSSKEDKDVLSKLTKLLSELGTSIKSDIHLTNIAKMAGLNDEQINALLKKINEGQSRGTSSAKALLVLIEKIGSNDYASFFGADDETEASGLESVPQETKQISDVQVKRSNQNTETLSKGLEDSLKEIIQEVAEESEEAVQAEDTSTLDYLNHLAAMLDQSIEALSSAYGQVDVSALINENTKTLLITEVTEKMLAAKAVFDDFKNTALEKIETILNTENKTQLGEVVGKVAEKLDRLIMQSDITLYTDMKSERKLMGLSSDLQEIVALSKTSPDTAMEKLKEVKKKLDQLLYQPSKEKVVVSLKESAVTELNLEKESLVPELKANSGAKGMLDFMRALGLNNEVELMDQVFSQKGSVVAQEEQKDNFKQMLLKLSEEDKEDNQHLIKSIEKGISQLTGQQLLNKPEPQNDTQSMFFNLPLSTDNGDTDLKLYVKARKNADQMDWENCSMYFLVDLKQYGETGIRINVSQRQLSVSISNASSDIMDAVKPLAEEILSELKEIGYNPGDIKYVPFTPENQISELPGQSKLQNTARLNTPLNSSEVLGEGTGRKGFEWQI